MKPNTTTILKVNNKCNRDTEGCEIVQNPRSSVQSFLFFLLATSTFFPAPRQRTSLQSRALAATAISHYDVYEKRAAGVATRAPKLDSQRWAGSSRPRNRQGLVLSPSVPWGPSPRQLAACCRYLG